MYRPRQRLTWQQRRNQHDQSSVNPFGYSRNVASTPRRTPRVTPFISSAKPTRPVLYSRIVSCDVADQACRSKALDVSCVDTLSTRWSVDRMMVRCESCSLRLDFDGVEGYGLP